MNGFRSFIVGCDFERRGAVNEKERTASLAFSSEEPCLRSYGWEILDHGPAAVDLSRLNSGQANLLINHDPNRWAGVVVSARIVNRRGYAVIRFGNSAPAREIFLDVADGVLQAVSVGYTVEKVAHAGVNPVDGNPIVRITRWMPYEISLVTVPADNTVGVGRVFGERPASHHQELELRRTQRRLIEARREQQEAVSRARYYAACRKQALRNGHVCGSYYYP